MFLKNIGYWMMFFSWINMTWLNAPENWAISSMILGVGVMLMDEDFICKT